MDSDLLRVLNGGGLKGRPFVRLRRHIPAVRRIVIKINGNAIINMSADMGVLMSKIGRDDFHFSNGVLTMDLKGLGWNG